MCVCGFVYVSAKEVILTISSPFIRFASVLALWYMYLMFVFYTWLTVYLDPFDSTQ